MWSFHLEVPVITLKKIRTLKDRVQIRKCGSLMYEEARFHAVDDEYIEGLKDIVNESPLITQKDKAELSMLYDRYLSTRDSLYAKDIYYKILSILGEEMADWDFVDDEGSLDPSKRVVRKHTLFLDRIRSPYNIGAVFRSAESFQVDRVYLRNCGDVTSPRAVRTSRGAVDTVPYTVVDDLDMLKGRPVFALETGGEMLSSFSFPPDAICVLGSEEDGVSPEVLELCQSKVSIEQFGAKGSINVSVAAGILLYQWALS